MAPKNNLDVKELSQVIDTLPLPTHDLATPAPALASNGCPFHDSATTIDLLLAEIDCRDVALFDAALDLRSLCAAGRDAQACVEQLFRVRALLDERHYLAFYRVRCWARRALRVEVRPFRGAPSLTHELPLNGARIEEIINSSLALLASASGVIPAAAQVGFVFASST